MNYLNLGIAAALLFVLSVTHAFVYRAGQNQVQVKWEVEKVAHANALIAQESAHRAQERKWGQSITSLTDWHRSAQEASRHELETIIADRDAGTLRLRRDLAGCRVPSDTTPATGDNGTSDSGLSEARQGVLIRVGRDADRVSLRLQAAQRYIREVCGG